MEDTVWQRVQEHYKSDGCSTQNEFIAKAILFYCGYLQSEYAGGFLPKILGETLEAILSMFGDRIGKLLLKQAVEQMLLSILGCEAQLARDNPEYSRIMTVLQERIADNLSCCELAQELGMSQSNLKRVFSSYSRVGIMHYYRHLRTEYAAVLLKEGLSVHAVSERLNYSSQSAFCNSFKRMCGILPSDVRLINLKSTEKY